MGGYVGKSNLVDILDLNIGVFKTINEEFLKN